MKRITKKDATVFLLTRGRMGNPGHIHTVDEIMAKMLEVFPRSGTTKNSIYYWASKTPGVSLSSSNIEVDLSAWEKLTGSNAAPVEPEGDDDEEVNETESSEEPAEDKSDADATHKAELAAIYDQVRREVEAEIAEHVRLEKEKRAAAARAVRVVKKNERKQA